MSFVKEFREFALKGNVLDLAVAVIIGAAFGKIVDSLVKDVLMPIIGLLLGGVDTKSWFWNLGSGTYNTIAEAEAAKAPIIKYGLFFNAVIDFVAIALVVFFIVKLFAKLQKAAAAATAEDILLLREIRDSLKKR